MFFLDGDRYLLGGVLLVVANAAQSVAMMLYNSYLPQIAPPEERDAVSSRGWAFGYAAGSLVLVAVMWNGIPASSGFFAALFDIVVLGALLLAHWPSTEMVGS